MSHASIRAVFWDFGGVIAESPFAAMNRYEAEQGLPEDFLRMTNARNPDDNAWARFERGEISLDEFDRQFLEETRQRGHPVPGRELLPLLAVSIRPAMVRVLDALAPDFLQACLTNNLPVGQGAGMSTDADHAASVEAVMKRFAFVLESNRARARKPEPPFYYRACELAQVEPEQVVFLDDLGVNLKPARALGMHTIKVIDPEQAVQELADLLDRPLETAYKGE